MTETKKSLGQHWLKDQASLEAICRAAEAGAGDQVLEIGPGTGELTKALLTHGTHVIALEFDQDLIESLQAKFKDQNVQVVQGDIRTYDLTQLPNDYKIVANIPYYLTAYLLRLLTETSNKPQAAALLVQKEVAERVSARPGKMSFISVATQLYYDVSLGAEVPAQLFIPPPKVDSQVLVLQKLVKPRFADVDYAQLLKFIKLGFAQPRKTLVNNLHNGLKIERSEIEANLTKLNLSPTIRAQEIRLDIWHSLYESFVRGSTSHKVPK